MTGLCTRLCVVVLTTVYQLTSGTPTHHVKMPEAMIQSESFLVHAKSNADEQHEVIFVIKQGNTEKLEDEVLQRSTPGNSKYQQWLTYDEVTAMTSNEEGSSAVSVWLDIHGIQYNWLSKHRKHYLQATSSIEQWESLLNTTFYRWHDKNKSRKHTLLGEEDTRQTVNRAVEYSLPSHLVPHLDSIFNTVQAPVELRKQYHTKPAEQEEQEKQGKPQLRRKLQGPGSVTVEFLNQLYRIQSNIGNETLSSAIFSTQDEYFSTTDLKQFQENYGLTVQV